MRFRLNSKTLLVSVLTSFFIVTLIYSSNKFTWKENKVESINVYTNTYYKGIRPIVYLSNKTEVDFDLRKPYKHKIDDDSSFRFEFNKALEIRKFRLYFDQVIDSCLIINKIIFNKGSSKDEIVLKDLILNDVQEILDDKDGSRIGIKTIDGYIESPKDYIYSSDFVLLVIGLGSIVLILVVLFFIFRNVNLIENLQSFGLTDFSVILFIGSIFLPHPIFNITLALSLLMVIKNFKLKEFLSSKIYLIFIGLFLLLFFNDLFISASGYHNLKATEKYLPLFILPIYVSCIKKVNFLIYFPVSAIVIGVGLFLTSVLNATIFTNLEYFSFTEFTKFTHPVYYSYLLSFSIFYILLKVKLDKVHKIILQLILFLFLIFAGSKMVISITAIIYAVLLIRNKKAVIIMIAGVILLAFFPPVQKRFNEVLNLNDLSIINENVIIDNNDIRVNGLTLRLLLWQESINAIETIPEYIFGLGVDGASDQRLKSNLVERGLEKYSKYSSHNQFVNVFMRAGIVGVILLLFIIIYGFNQSIAYKNKMLLIMIVLFAFSMLTESVFQRVLGIYFFTTVLLFLMKPNFLNEDSDTWN